MENDINAVTITDKVFENISDQEIITDENLDNPNEILICSESQFKDNEAETLTIASRGSYKSVTFSLDL